MMTEDRGKQLTNLFIRWQGLIRDRAHARSGTIERSELDTIYLKVLPIIVQITEAVSDTEISELVNVAFSLLKQKEPGDMGM